MKIIDSLRKWDKIDEVEMDNSEPKGIPAGDEMDEVEMDNSELKEIPAIVVAMRIIGGLAILGGSILCIKSWPGSPPEDYTWKVVAYTPALTWLFSGIISGTLFFAGGAALSYLDNIQEGLSRILDKLGTSE